MISLNGDAVKFHSQPESNYIEFSTDHQTTELVTSIEFQNLLKKYVHPDHMIAFSCKKENSEEINTWSILGKLMHDCRFKFVSEILFYRLKVISSPFPYTMILPKQYVSRGDSRWKLHLIDLTSTEAENFYKDLCKLSTFIMIKNKTAEKG